MQAIRAAYIHVPFCRHRCGYCDFTLVAGRDDLIDRYLLSLSREMSAARSSATRFEISELKSVFFGGGTPTHPPASQLQQLLKLVSTQFPVAEDAEVSIEANPLDLTDEKLDVLQEQGVNRISLGVQSFAADDLRLLERDHHPRDVQDVMRRLQPRFSNISLDLIFGVPGQTLASWRQTLQQAIELGPMHISTYGLTWEEGTAFFTRRRRGEMQSVEDSLEREQYALAQEELAAAGFEHYELSNFAKPGFRCQHNLVYWNGDEYLAFGPGAARYVSGRRETNIRSVLGWLNRLEQGESPVGDAEELLADHRARELIYLGLRMIEGISREEFSKRTGWNILEFAASALESTTASGGIEISPTHVRLTPEGRYLADRVIAEFL